MAAEVKKEIELEIAHVLFTDIVGYSKLPIHQQRAVVERLNEIVRGTDEYQAAETAGRLIKIPTGDGITLVFYHSPEAPVECALEISRALKKHPELQLRMGVHSGPVSGVIDATGKANVAGPGINIAQRVMDCGDAGHILLSKHVAEDLEEYPHWQPHLHELGECEVKHGVRLSVVNLYTEELGNPAVPEKLKAARVAAAARRKRAAFRWLSLGVVSLLAVIGTSGRLTVPTEGPLFLYLLPLAACISLLGQPVHRDYRLAWVMTLLFLGLGLGFLTSQHVVGQLALVVLLGLITFLLNWHHDPFWPTSWLGIGTFGLGTLCTGLAVITDPPVSSVASLVACAILLPLVPFHQGYVSALTRLPGSLPSFIVLLLPAIGLHSLAAVIPTVPEIAISTVTVLALVGALYGSIKALAQSRVRLLLAYGSLSFFSILWWFAALSRTIMPQAVVFLSAVALVTSGLLLAWQVVRTRYGDDVDPRAISGLVRRMPRFAVLFSLLALAAMGLPPFGVFAGFIGMLLSASLTSSVALLIIVIAWLAASWYILNMVQCLVFGRERSDLRYEDLRRSELASLLIVVLIVIALGVAPSSLFGITQQPPSAGAVKESVSWNR